MLRAQSEFQVQPGDQGVRVTAPLRLKVSNTIRLRVDLTAFNRAS